MLLRESSSKNYKQYHPIHSNLETGKAGQCGVLFETGSRYVALLEFPVVLLPLDY